MLEELKKALTFLKVIVGALLIILFTYVISFSLKGDEVSRVDYVNFITAAKIVWEGLGENLYDINFQHTTQQGIISRYYETSHTLLYMSPPHYSLLFIPFTYFPLVSGYRLAVLVILAAFFVIGWFVRKVPKVKLKPLSVYLLILFFPPSVYVIFNAHFTPLLILALLGTYIYLKRKKDSLAGFLVGLLWLKMQYILMAPFLLLLSNKRSRFVKGFVLSSLLQAVLSLILVGFEELLSYPGFLLFTNRPEYAVKFHRMVSIHAMMKTMSFFDAYSAGLVWLINFAVFFVIFFVFLKKYKKSKFEASFASAVLLSIPFSAHVFLQDLVFLLVPFFILLRLYQKSEGTRRKNFYLEVALFTYLIPFVVFFGNISYASLAIVGMGLLLLIKYPDYT